MQIEAETHGIKVSQFAPAIGYVFEFDSQRSHLVILSIELSIQMGHGEI